MKKILIILCLVSVGFIFFSCEKDNSVSENLSMLTNHIWIADSLLADGVDASGADGLLEDFKGDTRFNSDGTGYVGTIAGTWQFSENETQIIITSASLPIPVTLQIVELNAVSLKLTTSYPKSISPPEIIGVRMTFVPK
jgi:hypothetical protein